MRFLKIGLILSVAALFIIACGEASRTNNTANNASNQTNAQTNTNTATSSSPAATDELASGKTVYAQTCVNCHKEDGTGGKRTIEGKTINAENLTTDKMKNMADDKYIKYIENGIPDEGMPAFKGRLSDEQIKNVVKFIRKEFQGK